MTRARIPVYNQTADWPRKVAELVNSMIADLEQSVLIAGSAAAASINYIGLEGDATASGFDGLLLSGDANVTDVDFLLHS